MDARTADRCIVLTPRTGKAQHHTRSCSMAGILPRMCCGWHDRVEIGQRLPTPGFVRAGRDESRRPRRRTLVLSNSMPVS